MSKQERIEILKAQLLEREKDNENRSYYKDYPEYIAAAELYRVEIMDTDAKVGQEVFVFEIDPKCHSAKIFDIRYKAIRSAEPASQHAWTYQNKKLVGSGVVVAWRTVAWIRTEDEA